MRKNIRHTCDDLSRRIADNYIETVENDCVKIYLKRVFENIFWKAIDERKRRQMKRMKSKYG